ncbi:transcriptional regulator [Cribrihabitans marinus]|nr:transcriptional regulator [Cribrihabitans marinus]
MLSLMAYHSTSLAALFHALSDPTRLAVTEALCDGPQPVSRLAAPHDMALPSFLKHLKVLEAAGVTTSEKQGRTRIVALRTERLAEGQDWFAERRRLWSDRFDALEAHLDRTQETPK